MNASVPSAHRRHPAPAARRGPTALEGGPSPGRPAEGAPAEPALHHRDGTVVITRSYHADTCYHIMSGRAETELTGNASGPYAPDRSAW